jgi:serine/threonine protein kinase
MPKDSFLIGTPPSHSSNHFSRISEKKYDQVELTRLIGRGTFSQVYLSKDKKTGETLAVKIMDLRRFEEEFNSEVSILMSLTQKGVNVNFLSSEVDEDNDTGYIYMNYIPFPTLSEFLEKATYGLKEEEAIQIFSKLVNIIDDIHSCGIAHKDLKPENIFVDPSSHEVSVIDFGLSSVVDGKKEKKFCGSPLYMAPEMLNKEDYDPIQADVWSIGVILYEMLLGCNPWARAECLEDLIELVSRIEFPSFLSEHSIGLLSGMLVLDPIQRDSLKKIKIKIDAILEKYVCDNMSTSF